jgi:uncharacterized OsmC-like protein
MQTMTKAQHVLNGVNTDDLMKTIHAVREQPELARFRFRASNTWLGGGHNRSTAAGFYGTMQEIEHATHFQMEAGEPPVLLGNDEGANPVEHLLHALAACVTTSMVYHAAARGIRIRSVESRIEGDLDLRGFLGIDHTVRNGYQCIRMYMKIGTDAGQEEWSELVGLGPAFSPVFDSVMHGVPVEIHAERA